MKKGLIEESMKKKRQKWSETVPGQEFAREKEAYDSWVAAGGPQNVDPNLCFVCQEKTPTHSALRNATTFLVCDDCAKELERQATRRARILQALGQGRGGDMLRMVLGVDLLPTRIMIENLPTLSGEGDKK